MCVYKANPDQSLSCSPQHNRYMQAHGHPLMYHCTIRICFAPPSGSHKTQQQPYSNKSTHGLVCCVVPPLSRGSTTHLPHIPHLFRGLLRFSKLYSRTKTTFLCFPYHTFTMTSSGFRSADSANVRLACTGVYEPQSRR